MGALRLMRLPAVQRSTVLATFLGPGAGCFFLVVLVVLVVPAVAGDFVPAKNGVIDTAPVAPAITLMLAMRPLGTLIFGLLRALRYRHGR